MRPSFATAARRAIAAAKPIVVLKIGLSEVTARSAQAHTGALVGDDRVFDGVCRQLGIVRVDSIEDLLFTADVIVRTGVLQPRGLGVVSISGGACEIVADRAQVLGVPMPGAVGRRGGRVARRAAEFRHAEQSAGHHRRRGAAARPVRAGPAHHGQTAGVLRARLPVRRAGRRRSRRPNSCWRRCAISPRDCVPPTVPALMISHTVKPVTEVSTRIIEEIGLPYVSAGLHHGMNALGRAFWWSEQYRRLAAASRVDRDDRSGSRAPAIRARHA